MSHCLLQTLNGLLLTPKLSRIFLISWWSPTFSFKIPIFFCDKLFIQKVVVPRFLSLRFLNPLYLCSKYLKRGSTYVRKKIVMGCDWKTQNVAMNRKTQVVLDKTIYVSAKSLYIRKVLWITPYCAIYHGKYILSLNIYFFALSTIYIIIYIIV